MCFNDIVTFQPVLIIANCNLHCTSKIQKATVFNNIAGARWINQTVKVGGDYILFILIYFFLRGNVQKNQTKSNFFAKALKLDFAPLLHIASS